MVKEKDYVELGLTCAEVRWGLDQRINGRRAEQLSQPALKAIESLKA